MAYRNSVEAWVTYAGTDEACNDVLILAASLRRFKTNRRTVVLIGREVSKSMRFRLNEVFDVVDQNIEVQEKLANLDLLTSAKISTWSLTTLKKCVFLNPNTLVLQNCDDIFNLSGIQFGNASDELNISTLMMQPSREIFERIMELAVWRSQDIKLKSSAGFGKNFLAELLSDHFSIQNLDEKYNYSVDLLSSNQKQLEDAWGLIDPRIINFCECASFKWIDGKIVPEFLQDVMKFIVDLEMETEKKNSLTSNLTWNSSKDFQPNEPIAIVGMSCRLPGANNMEEYWNLMMNREDAIGLYPEGRPMVQMSFKASEKGRQAGFLKCPIDQFDTKFFEMSPNEVEMTDPQHRLLMEVAWEALEDAGIDPISLRNSTAGVYTGLWRSDYKELLMLNQLPVSKKFRWYMGNAFSNSCGRIAHFLRTIGPNSVNESGCSAALVTIAQAVKDLRLGKTAMAIAGGVNLLVLSISTEGFQGMVSPDGHCKTFEASADGFGRAEGCGVLVLKTLSSAVKDKDRIYALIRGYGICQEGMSNSMGTPTVQCEAMAMKMALRHAQVHPLEISFVETHGTGTAVGDPVEVSAIADAYSTNERSTPLILGAVKANIGHTESCSGMAGVIKVALAMWKETIPPHFDMKELNPAINFESIPAVLPLTPTPWNRTSGVPRLAGVSSFGITGTDAHLIMEEAPIIPEFHQTSPCGTNLLNLSAKSPDALKGLLASYEDLLNSILIWTTCVTQPTLVELISVTEQR